MRNFINIMEQVSVDRNQALIDYLSSGESAGFTPNVHWRMFAEWAPHAESGEVVADLEDLSGEELSSEEFDDETANVMKLNPNIFWRLPKDTQKEFYNTLADIDLRGNSSQSFKLISPAQLPDNTLLVHFTDNAGDIQKNGFTIGVSDMHLLGETVRLPQWMKSGYGYNFAYLASQASHALQNGSFRKSQVVVFKNSGVLVQHFGDTEQQVIFWGRDVSVSNIIGVGDADDLPVILSQIKT